MNSPPGRGPRVLRHEDLVSDQVIGTGAFGEVSLGTYRPTGMRVAIKKLHIVTGVANYKDLFMREVNMLALLGDRFILPFVGYTDDPPYCLVTKYVPNGSLHDALHENPRGITLTPTDLTAIAYGIARGLASVHRKGLIHRDLKSENILLDENLLPVVGDFGSARKNAVSKALTASVGTVTYSAPELIQGNEYDASVDVYSFGVILWEMVTGQVPWNGLQTPQVIYKVVMQNAQLPVPSDVPEPLGDLIQACLSADPSQRPTFERIVTKIENGYVCFEGADFLKFQEKIQDDKRTRREKHRSNLGRVSTALKVTDCASGQLGRRGRRELPLMKSASFTPRLNMKLEKDVEEKLAAHLQMLTSVDEQTVERAVTFLELMVVNVSQMKNPGLWPSLMKFLYDGAFPELVERVNNIAISCAKSKLILETFGTVEDPSSCLNERTLEVFLYVTRYEVRFLDTKFIKELCNLLTTNMECRVKCIKLLYWILLSANSDMKSEIVGFFRENIFKFAEVEGGDIILHSLAKLGMVTPDVLIAYHSSRIEQNAIAAYQCFFCMNAENGMFQMSVVLPHITAAKSSLRKEALEYIRRYLHEIPDDIFMWVLHGLITIVINYHSDAAVLLLCCVMDGEKGAVLLRDEVVEMWLSVEKEVARRLMRLFITAAAKNQKYGRFLMHHRLTPQFLASVLECHDKESALALCWFITTVGPFDEETGSAIAKSGVSEALCNVVIECEWKKSLDRILIALKILIPFHYCEVYSSLVTYLLNHISNGQKFSNICVAVLSPLSAYAETHQNFLDGNYLAVLRQFKDETGEAAPFIQNIFQQLSNPK